MKRDLAALAGVLLAGMAWVQPATAQNMPPGYGERRGVEPGYGERRYGDDVRERCYRLRGEFGELRERMERERDPRDRQRMEERLREVREQEERAGCRR